MRKLLHHLRYSSADLKTLALMLLLYSTAGITAIAASGADEEMEISGEMAINVTGTIVDQNGEPLPGVSVLVQGTTTGTVTDLEGNYSIEVPEGGALVFSFIGFKSQVIQVADQSQINVTMEEDARALDEVVVVGYGTLKKSDLTGSVGSVKGDKLIDRSQPNAVKSLQGRIAGVEVLNNQNSPGASARIRIRGINSINSGVNPLFVIDGVIGADLNMINPADIESVEVLKDASSAAIYGARGANGVIMITTKRGEKNLNQISYDSFVSLSHRAGSVKTLNANQFMEIYNRAFDNAAKYDPQGFAQGRYQRADPADFPDLFDANGQPIYDTNWEEEIYNPAWAQNHNLAFRGGSNTTSYNVSLGYTNEDGIMMNSGFERFTGKIALDSDIKPWLTIGGSMLGTKSSRRVVDDANGALNVARMTAEALPIIPLRYPDGRWGSNADWPGTEGGENPVNIAQNRYTDVNITQMYADFYMNFKITQDLEFRSTFSTIFDTNKSNFYSSRNLRLLSADQRGVASVGMTKRLYWQNENFLTWNKSIGERHRINGMFGFSWQRDQFENLSVRSEGFIDDFFQWRNIRAGNIIPISGINGNVGEAGLNSFFSRWNYTLDDKYLLTVTGRYDGSSRFGRNNKFAFFPSIGLGWNLSEEGFMDGLSGVNKLKIRGSAGSTGNQEIGNFNSLQFLGTFNVLKASGNEIGISQTSFGNPDLLWESTDQFDFGVELGLFNSRLMMEADLYYKKTKNLLLNAPLPWSTGFSSVLQNIGSVENKGLELTFNTVNIEKGDFMWTTDLNWSTNSNKILSLGANDADIFPGPWFLGQTNILRVGEPIGSIWGRVRLGTWNQDQADQAAEYGLLPGDIRWQDLDNNNVINANDSKIIGRMYPKWVGNITNTFQYRNFDFSFEFRAVQGMDVINATLHSVEDRQTLANSYATVLDAWRPDNQDAMVAEVRAWGTPYLTNMDTHWMEDGSFVRLQNLMLGYTVPANILSRYNINRARFFLSGQNLLLFTEYTGYDPEVNTFEGAGQLPQGLDFFPFARPRTYSAGVNITF
ncbi:TonB-linked outer membrane protein, SusC/RagA family [Cyclobacterium lianum]|uniref:TonB-linked outer membrane protein, SusC/RagA family n=1 Tax=Cyclobacterium lianum TaxID=388280 RepID=A0A1M7P4A9_9BACT|nr:TonB-dependent receptor [Cyclobacterium lianum]SHN11448.1 TonB-linked outer membrane protein, SusC/RagA family [Cyclobacterium lianum]